jgi:hypothetical protein
MIVDYNGIIKSIPHYSGYFKKEMGAWYYPLYRDDGMIIPENSCRRFLALLDGFWWIYQ